MAIGGPLARPQPARARDPVLAAAGDIACPASDTTDPCKQGETARLIESQHPDAVAPLGDNQYERGELSEFYGKGAYNETWGRFNAIAHPVPGNHEYDTPNAEGYFDYFGTAAGGGYYSYDLGAWHIVALNSNCSDLGCQDSATGMVSSAQARWLRADLASHPSQCILAYWHHPAFTTGSPNVPPESPGVLELWNILYAAGADVVLNGHDHKYERFAQQDPSQAPTSAGIREFVVGTGGQTLFAASEGTPPNLQALDVKDFGVLFLTLHPYSYDWVFRAVNGTAPDRGTTACHAQPPPPSPSDPPAAPLPPASPPPLTPTPTQLERLRFTARVARVVHRGVLRRGLGVQVYCSTACSVKSVTVLVRSGGRTVRKARYTYAKQIGAQQGVLRLKLKGIRTGARLVLTLEAVSATGERRSATAATRLAR